ncbi:MULTISPECIES: hypothetical protein [Bacillaceae]|jgi:ribose/xylose/arabinose/galactoside ABC-type transport system permease subunit|nr:MULTISPECIES: hypothetical protein [Bacillaceae]MBU8791343.1 hypothetical protein [Oceanobacillus caeni]
MMGAMLGDMVAMTRPNAIINIMALMITMILLLVLYTAEESIRKQANQETFSFFKHPFLLIFTIAILFLILSYIDPLDFNIQYLIRH